MPSLLSSPPAYKNRVLASLSTADIKHLSPHLTPVTLKSKRSINEAGERIETVYFLEDAVASVVVTLEDGTTVEVGLVGREGIVGLPAVMGDDRGLHRTFIQVPGRGFSVKAKVVRELVDSSSEFRSCMFQALQGYIVQTAQTAACNRVHELAPRLARWLMMCSDRVQSDRIPITHEFLGMMLGTHRSSVTIAAGILNEAGLIDHTRGSVTIQNREGLAQAACECYRTVNQEYVRLGLL